MTKTPIGLILWGIQSRRRGCFRKRFRDLFSIFQHIQTPREFDLVYAHPLVDYLTQTNLE